VSGRVVGFPDGEPVSGVQLVALDRGGRGAAAVTDAAGDYRIEGVDDGWIRVRARPELGVNRVGAYFDDAYFFCGADELRAEEDPEGVDFALPEGGVLTGRVLDASGEPVPGAAVTARGLDFYNQYLVRTDVADDDGRWTVEGLDSIVLDGTPTPGLYLLSAAAPGQPAAFHGSGWSSEGAEPVPASRGEMGEIDLQLPPLATLTGRVTDAEGLAVSAATVTARVVGHGPGPIVTTEADGSFRLEGVPGAAARVQVSAEGFAVSWSGGDVETDQPATDIDGGGEFDLGDLALMPEALAQVRVLGEDIDGARVRLRRDPDGAVLAQHVVTVDDPVALFDRLPRTTVFAEVVPPPGSTSQGWASDPLTIDVDEVRSIEVGLPPGGFVEGRVLRREAGPLRGARVRWHRGLGSPDPLPPAVALTDGDGAFRLGPIREDTGWIEVTWEPFCSGDPGRAPVWAPAGRQEGDASSDLFVIRPGETIADVEVRMPFDGDRDGMDDVWELLWGLDPDRADATGDPDGDGVANLDEYRERTDPLGAVRVGSGCAASISGVPASAGGPIVLAVIATRRRRRPSSWAADPVC